MLTGFTQSTLGGAAKTAPFFAQRLLTAFGAAGFGVAADDSKEQTTVGAWPCQAKLEGKKRQVRGIA